jgi:carbonyl reductase 1
MSEAPSKRLALVTGSTRGIGEAIAHGLAARGLEVLVSGRDAGRGRAVAAAIPAATFLPLDVTSEANREAAARWIESERGGLDVLVNNSGVSLDGFDAEVARRTLDVNFVGAVHLTDRLLPRLRDGARIVMVSSGLGELTCVGDELRERFLDPGLDRRQLFALTGRFVAEVAAGTYRTSGWPGSAYRVSKVALNAYVRILARELVADARGILVNAVCPGWVKTQMGGRSAPRSVPDGAKTPLWLALLPAGGEAGGFFRDERPVDW